MFAGQLSIPALAHRVQGFAGVPYDVDLVEQDAGLRRVLRLGVELRNAFHMFMTASRIFLLFLGPSCLRLQRGCGVRGWGLTAWGRGRRRGGARARRAFMLTLAAW